MKHDAGQIIYPGGGWANRSRKGAAQLKPIDLEATMLAREI